MDLKQSLTRIGGIVTALGIGNLFDLTALLAKLNLPDWVLTAPGWIKWPVVGAAVVYALLGIVKTSHTNPDGTDATRPYQESRDTDPLPPNPYTGLQ